MKNKEYYHTNILRKYVRKPSKVPGEEWIVQRSPRELEEFCQIFLIESYEVITLLLSRLAQTAATAS